MVIVKEEYFPRGGRKPPSTEKSRRRPAKLFGDQLKSKKGKLKTKPKEKLVKDDTPVELGVKRVEPLTFRTVQEGMLVLGCVAEISQMSLRINLPGRTFGKVFISNISTPYSNLLRNVVQSENDFEDDYHALSSMFQIGQLVACKVIEIKHDLKSEFYQLKLSIAPQDVQSEWKFSQLQQEMLISAAIESVEDHGYIMDTGIRNCRAFLPKVNVDDGKAYKIGQVVQCYISKVDMSNISSTITLDTKEVTLDSFTCTNLASLNNVLPGMRVAAKIQNLIADGLELSLYDDFKGYVHTSHLSKSFDTTSTYKINQNITARVLYIQPTTKFVFCSLKNFEKHSPKLKIGATFKKAKVLTKSGRGLYLQLTQNEKGYVSHNRLDKKPQSDQTLEELLNLYTVESKHAVRILNYDAMDDIYYCTMEPNLLRETIFLPEDLQPGQIVEAVIKEIDQNGVNVTVGRLHGYVVNDHTADVPLTTATLQKKYSPGDKVKARVLTTNGLYLTFKQSLIESTLPCLTSYTGYDANQQYIGSIIKIKEKGLIVSFYNLVTAYLDRSFLKLSPKTALKDTYYLGQTIKVFVLSSNPKTKKMSLKTTLSKMLIGTKLSGIVKKVYPFGITLNIKQSREGFIPLMHLTENTSLSKVLARLYKPGDEIKDLICIALTPKQIILSLREGKVLNEFPDMANLKKGDILRCDFSHMKAKGIYVCPALTNFNKKLFISKDFVVADKDVKSYSKLHFEKLQLVLTKVRRVNLEEKQILCSASFSYLWDHTFTYATNLMAEYLRDVDYIRSKTDHVLTSVNIGDKVKGRLTQCRDGYKLNVKSSDCYFLAPLIHCNQEDMDEGKKVSATVLWVDFAQKHAVISLLADFQNFFKQEDPVEDQDFEDTCVKAKIILIYKDFTMGIIKSRFKNKLVFLPKKVHPNDFKPQPEDIKIGDVIDVVVFRSVNDKFIGISREKYENAKLVFKRNIDAIKEENVDEDDEPETKRQKLNESEEDDEEEEKKEIELMEIEKSESESEPEVVVPQKKKKDKPKEKKRRKSKSESDDESIDSKVAEPTLPGADLFWNLNSDMLHDKKQSDESSDEDDTENSSKSSKKKKMTKAEKRAEAMKEEQRLRQIENKLADDQSIPTSAEEFDRLILAQPNNSHVWINYMAFHLQATEIEKARTVAQKAITTISYREEQERLNVWIALLNLENRYGTKETFNKTLSEAVQVNDAKAVHLRALNILAESGNQNDYNDLLKIVLRKYKQDPDMWLQAATASFKLDLVDNARHLLQRALTSLDAKHHVNIIVQFAQLEIKQGNQDRAETLYEQVLTSYPRRIDIWSSYVDMLIKSKKIDIARKVLERSVSLTLPARKMKILFKKFLEFEEKYGDAEAVGKVREMAVKYVENATN